MMTKSKLNRVAIAVAMSVGLSTAAMAQQTDRWGIQPTCNASAMDLTYRDRQQIIRHLLGAASFFYCRLSFILCYHNAIACRCPNTQGR